jgi:hypothetical protein
MLSIYDASKDLGHSQTSVPEVVATSEAISEPGIAAAEESQLALAPEEIETLTSLVGRYDQLLAEVDALNLQIEALLQAESPKPVVTS